MATARIADGHPELGSLAEKYAIVALERADSYSLETERYLLIAFGLYSRYPKFQRDRNSETSQVARDFGCICSARLDREKDLSANPYFVDPPKQLDAPEDPRWNGVVDSAAMAEI